MSAGVSAAGCDACRRGAYSATWPPPERIGVDPAGPSFLHRCSLCGTFWEVGLRFAHVVPEAQARARYPQAFGPPER